MWIFKISCLYYKQSSLLNNLKERIIAACSSITSEMLMSVTVSILTWYEKGGHFENTLK